MNVCYFRLEQRRSAGQDELTQSKPIFGPQTPNLGYYESYRGCKLKLLLPLVALCHVDI